MDGGEMMIENIVLRNTKPPGSQCTSYSSMEEREFCMYQTSKRTHILPQRHLISSRAPAEYGSLTPQDYRFPYQPNNMEGLLEHEEDVKAKAKVLKGKAESFHTTGTGETTNRSNTDDITEMLTKEREREFHEFCEIPIPAPIPTVLDRFRRSRVALEPGAHAVGGLPTGVSVSNTLTVETPRMSSSIDPTPSLPTTLRAPTGSQDGDDANGNEGLAVANLIEEETTAPPGDLPHAQGVDLEAARTKSEESRKKALAILVVAFVVVVAAAVLVAVFVPTNGATSHLRTEAPSPSPSITLLALVDQVLSSFPKETHVALQDPNSPQAMAYAWLWGDTESLFNRNANQIKQRFILATLYYSTSGDDWVDNGNWLNHSAHECDWFHQPSFGQKHILAALYPDYLVGFMEPMPPICNGDGTYQHLWLDQLNLVGLIPLELFQMTSLQTFSAVFNELEGGLPSQVGLLTNLFAMDLAFNKLGGTIPVEIGQLTGLRTLGLVHNDHEGTIPRQLWKLSKLEGFLGLSQNPLLHGSLATEIGLISNLKVLNMEDCGLTGKNMIILWLLLHPLRSVILRLLRELLPGTLPTELGHLESLEWMMTSKNTLLGTVSMPVNLFSPLLAKTLSYHE